MHPLDLSSVFANFKEVYEDAGASDVHTLFVTRAPYKHFVSYTHQFSHEIKSLKMEKFSFDDIVKAVELGRKDSIEFLFWDLWYSYFDNFNYKARSKNIFGQEKTKFFVYEELNNERFKPLNTWFQSIDNRIQLNFPEANLNVTNKKKKNVKVENFLSSVCEESFNAFYRSRY